MAPRTLALWRGIGALALLIAWVTVSHLSDAEPNATGLGLLLGLGPMFVVALLFAWRAKWRIPALLLWGVAVAVACRYRDLLGAHLRLIDLAQDLAAYGALAYAFARSLAPDRTPLCTQWATVQHGPLPPPALVYTRRVTGAWALLFAGITALLVAVFVLASPRVWSLFSNFGAFALIGVMFVGEYLIRGRARPELAKGGILESLRAYARAQASPPRA